MFCPNCGANIAATPNHCSNCGWLTPSYSQQSIGDDAGMRLLLPVGRSPLAIVAGYLGLVSVIFIPAPFALVIGILAIIDIKKNPHKHGMGRAIFGTVMGLIFTLLIGIGIVAAILGN